MKATFVIGHKKPDTDSVCSSIALAYLKNKQGDNAIPRVLGDINNETKFVLNYFNIKEPKYINDVRLQLKDINYGKDCYCNENVSLYEVIQYLKENHLSSIPLVDENKKYKGLVSMKNIANSLISWDYDKLITSYENIIKTLKGQEILKFDEEIDGNILVASYRSTTFIKNIKLTNKDILIVGDRHSIIEYAVNAGVKLIIVTGNNIIKEEHIEIARQNKVNIIKTELRTFNVVKVIGMCNYAKTLAEYDVTCFKELDYLYEFNETHNKLRHKVYPVLSKYNDCLGVIQPTDINNKIKKKVFLVDHNEKEQTVDGIDDAEIVGIVDHHKLGTIGTSRPINFRNMPVGCTATIIYQLYKENNIYIPKDIAGLMMSAIISDTLLFRSPTTSDLDIETAKSLSKICEIDINEYAMKMFKAGSSIKNKTMEEVLYTDFKTFNESDYKIGVGQISTLNVEELIERKNDIIATLEKESQNNDFDICALFVTDIINEGSYVFYNKNGKHILDNAFNIENIEQGTYLPGIISRKQQIIPNILNVIE